MTLTTSANTCMGVLIIILMTMCNPAKTGNTETVAFLDTVRGEASLPHNQVHKEEPVFYKWAGNIRSNIPVSAWFVVKGKILKGELTYLKTKYRSPITILGSVKEHNRVEFSEFQKNGLITGTFSGKLSNDSCTGTWSSPKSGRDFPFELVFKDTTLANADTSFIPASIPGEYAYKFGDKGPGGGITIKEISHELYSFEINCVTGAPGYNVAELTADSIRFSDNAVVYSMPHADKCQFSIKVFKGFLIIDYLNENYDCGFGLNASVDGVFLKTK